MSQNALYVDLSRNKIWKKPIEKKLIRNYLGGRGINSRILYDLVKPGIDPLGPDNILAIGVGPFTGTLVPGSGRASASALSPLGCIEDGTSIIGYSNIGGFFGPELRFAGYNHIIIKGEAKRPVYLWVNDENVEIRDARFLWGKTTWDTYDILHSEIKDERMQMLAIGPAGENKVGYACITGGLERTFGRTGLGAVMGSKKLKAMVVRGTRGIHIEKPKRLLELFYKAVDALIGDANYPFWSIYGELGLIETSNDIYGIMSTRNHQTGICEYADKVSGERFVEKYSLKNKACWTCPLHGRHAYRITEGKFAGTLGHAVGYPALCDLGPRIGNDDMEICLKAQELADKYGLDTISLGGTIAFAMECYEKKLLTKEDTGGLDLTWGNKDILLGLIEDIAFRKGFGYQLGEGSYRLAKKIGKGAEKYSMTTKGVEHIEYDPRGLKGWGLAYAVCNRGADHASSLMGEEFGITPEAARIKYGTEKAASRFSEEGKGKMVKWHEDNRALCDALEICKFITRTALVSPKWYTDFLEAITGYKLTESEIMKIGERIINLERAFNVRQGATRKDDTLPKRFVKEPMPDGPSKGHVVHLNPMLDEYYEARGWDKKTGIPTRKTLAALDLVDIADELERLDKFSR